MSFDFVDKIIINVQLLCVSGLYASFHMLYSIYIGYGMVRVGLGSV